MYKQHLKNTKDVEHQVEEVVRDMGRLIEVLTDQLQHISTDIVTSTLHKLKANNDKLKEVMQKLVTKNKHLEDTIKAQSSRIQFLEANIAKMKCEMKETTRKQEAVNSELQAQINEIRKSLMDSDSKVETNMRSIVTTVMAANKFKKALGNASHRGDKDKLKPQ